MGDTPIFPITYGTVHIRVFTSGRTTSTAEPLMWVGFLPGTYDQVRLSIPNRCRSPERLHRKESPPNSCQARENEISESLFCYKRPLLLASRQNANPAGVTARFKAAVFWYRINVSSFNIKETLNDLGITV